MQLDLGRFWRSSCSCWPAVVAATARAASLETRPRRHARSPRSARLPTSQRAGRRSRDVTYTQQSEQGPTTVVEGYFAGDVEAAHDDFKRELDSAGFTILFDELEENDSEVSWKGQGRSGQVALRNECGSSDKVFVHITNRPG